MQAFRRFSGTTIVDARLQAIESQLEMLYRKWDSEIGTPPSHWDVLYRVSEKIDVLLQHRHSADRTDAHISRETNRLDSYLQYHVDLIREDLDLLREMALAKAPRGPSYLSPGLDVLLDMDGFDVIVPSSEAGLLAYFSRHGFADFEPAVRSALRRHLHPGSIAVDGGMNIGLHSLVMASAVGSEGSLTTFEALPHLISAASRTLQLNGFGTRCRVMHAALADSVGEAEFYVATHSPVSSMFEPSGMETSRIVVPQTSIDAEFPSGSRVDLVKLDIEGAEPLAWRGMTRLAAENPQLVVIMEWSASHFRRSGQDETALMQMLCSSGFTPWLLRDDRPEEPDAIELSLATTLEGANLLFKR